MFVRPPISYMKLLLQFLINPAHKCVMHQASYAQYLKYSVKDNVIGVFLIGFINWRNVRAVSSTLHF